MKIVDDVDDNEKEKPQKVVVTDFDIPFRSIVFFIIKSTLASIVAFIVVAAPIYFLLFISLFISGLWQNTENMKNNGTHLKMQTIVFNCKCAFFMDTENKNNPT